MSYARFGWEGSSVYVFFNTDGFIECCGCSLRSDRSGRAEYRTVADMELHLKTHEAAGHTVPASCYRGMRDDRERGELR